MKYPDDFVNKIIQGDCLKVLKEIPDNVIDLVIADPPYNTGVKTFGKTKEKRFFDKEFHQKWLKECDRIIKPTGQMYVFWWPEFLKQMVQILDFKQVLFWTKPFARMFKNPNRWENFTEIIFWKTYSDKYTFHAFRDKNNADYFTDPSCIHLQNERWHPTEKPLSLIQKLIMASSNPNDLVLDPFVGSGTTAVAAKRLGRRFIGIEKVKEYCQIARQRLRQEVLL
ncbi:site-specific DNA-methyltransferase [bacterium]|nr:site-specific DNA-methyltransferase [bacterium]